MSNKEKKYRIADKTYIQRPLVLGQIQQLLGLLKDVSESIPEAPDIPKIPDIEDLEDLEGLEDIFEKHKWKDRKATLSLIGLLGEKLPAAIAVVLIPEGQTARERNLEEIEKDLYDCPPETAVEVIRDFLSFSRNSLIIKKASAFLKEKGKMQGGGSSASSTSSPAEMS